MEFNLEEAYNKQPKHYILHFYSSDHKLLDVLHFKTIIEMETFIEELYFNDEVADLVLSGEINLKSIDYSYIKGFQYGEYISSIRNNFYKMIDKKNLH